VQRSASSPHRRPGPAGARSALALPLAGGVARARGLEAARAEAATLPVGLVHTQVAPHTATLSELLAATRALEASGAALVVWSEGVVAGVLDERELEARFGGGLPGVRVPVWIGAVVAGEHGRVRNAALRVSPLGIERRHDKQRLVPFAERWPGGIARERVGLRGHDFEAGSGADERASPEPVLPTICFEDTLPGSLARRVDATGAALIVNLTSDAWFRRRPRVAEAHLRLARLRAIEVGRDLVRATESGATAWVDAGGAVRARAPHARLSTVLVEPALLRERTLHTRIGEAPLAVAALSLVAFWAAGGRRRARAPRRALPPT
jgi:apolipoprotein N-acyltransferase